MKKYCISCMFFKNLSFWIKIMKGYASTFEDYNKEYRYFDLELLESLHAEKDFNKCEYKEALKKNWINEKEFGAFYLETLKDQFLK